MDGDPEDEHLALSLARTELFDDRRSFRARVEVESNAPISPDERAVRQVTVDGAFIAADDLTGDYYDEFTNRTPLVLLWPYARAYLADLGRMLGVSLPPLPTIDALDPLEPRTGGEASRGELDTAPGDSAP